MFCSNCGTKINDGDSRFCPNCGMPVSSRQIDNNSKIILIIISILLVFILGYVYFVMFLNNDEKQNTIVKNKTEKTEVVKKKEEMSEKKPMNTNLPSKPQYSNTIVKDKENTFERKIATALYGFRYTTEITKPLEKKGKVLRVKLFQDGQSHGDSLNAFASYFSVCYGYSEYDVLSANISLVNPSGKVLMSMGIGKVQANTISTGVWRGFRSMGEQLKNFVLRRQVENPAGIENACYFFKTNN